MLKGSADEVADGIKNVAKSTDAVDDLGNAFKGLGVQIGRIAPLALGLFSIGVALYGVHKYLNRFNDAVEKSAKSFSAYKEASSELENLKNQSTDIKSQLESIAGKYNISLDGMDDVDSMISKVESVDTIELTDKADLENLRSQNVELERQIQLQQKATNEAKKKSKEDALNAIEMKTTNDLSTKKDAPKNALAYGILMGNGATAAANEEVYEKTDIITATENEVKALEKLKEKRKELLDKRRKNSDGNKKDEIEAQIKSVESEISKFDKSISDNIATLDGLKDSLKDTSYFDRINDVTDAFNNIDLNPTEKVLKSINSAFDSKNSNSIKDSIIDMLKSGDVNSATDALHRLGITLSDLGIKGEGKKKIFDDYFDELINNANEAENAIKKVDGTFNGVKTAFESANQGAEYDQMKEFIKKAKELKKNGDVGTDDFQSVAQFGVNYDIAQKLKEEADAYTFASDAYVEAYEKSIKLLNRWYGNEDDNKNMHNILSDFKSKGLARELDKDTFSFKNKDGELMFKTTAEAANKLGTSVQNVELAMDKLREKGFEFDGIQKSGELLGEYNTQLERLKELSKTTEDSDRKKELDTKIKDWEDEAEKFKNPEYLASLTEEQIIKIKFEYDLESINQEIAALKEEIDGTGGTAEQRGQLIAKEQRKQKLLSSQSGMEKATSDNGFKESEKQFDNFSDILESKYEELGSKGRRVVQDQQLAISDLQNSYLEMFKNGDITNWNDFLNTEQAKTIFDELSSKTGETITNFEDMKQAIADVLGVDVKDLNFEVDADTSKAEEKLSEILSDNKKTTIMIDASTEEVQSAINKLKSEGETGAKIVFTADVDGVSSEVAAVKNEDGTISYIANVDGVQYYVNQVKNEDGTISYELGKYPKAVPDAKQIVNREPNDTGVSTNPKDVKQKANREAVNPPGIFNPLRSITQYVKRIFTGDSQLAGTAHFHGTAYSSGTFDNSFVRNEWKTSKGEVALTGEKAPEIVANGNKWWTVGDNGAEFSYIPPNSVVFNAEQSKQLLEKGYINSRGTSYLSGTAYNAGGRLPSSSISSKKNKPSKTSNKTSKKPSTKKKSSSSKSSSSKSSAEKAAEDLIDWIAVLLERVAKQTERAIEAIDTAIGLVNKQSATSTAISKVQNEIAKQQQAYNAYLSKANSLGLSSDYVNKVQNGSLNIENVKNEDLKKKIEDYKKWLDFSHVIYLIAGKSP